MFDLTKYSKTKQKFKSGFYPKYTFEIDGNKYFFKINVLDPYTNVYAPQDLIEVFSSDFYKTVGFEDYVQYQFAKCGKEKGCVCKSYLTPDVMKEFSFTDILEFNYYNQQDQKIYPLSQKFNDRDFDKFDLDIEKKYDDDGTEEYPQYGMSKEMILGELKTFCETYDIKISEKVGDQLNAMIVLDYFTCNTDRNWTNFKFLLKNKKSPYIELAPLFDNGYNFGLNCFYRNKTPETTIFMNRIGFSNQGIKNNLSYSKLLTDGGLVAVDIFNLTQNNPTINNLVQNIQKVNIENLVEQFEKINKLKLDDEIKTKICGFFNYRRNQYNKTIARLKTKIKPKTFEK